MDPTRATTVALVTSRAGLEYDDDLPLVTGALAAHGLTAEPVRWDAPGTAWERFGGAVVRSVWDYVERIDAFLSWADRTARVTRLWNPAPLIRWNSDKHYLRELARQGVPVVPTRFLAPGAPFDPRDLDGADGVVVKPAVSAGALDTARYERGAHAEAARHVRMLLERGRAAMVQPYLPRVAEGERALVLLDGVLSHAVRKEPLLTEPGVIDNDRMPHPGLAPYRPSGAEVRTALAALAALPRRTVARPPAPLFARVDLVLGATGEPLVLELELVEPNLFLTTDPGAPARFAEAVAARAAAPRRPHPRTAP
ncbi:RimK family alpha-L-glutamate ligase [Kitasatospora sp. NPDC056327]|uniref:ATP-grasp domain-containing protein n=1 Tax=Kitasatospora sp. NPDC056327 TaxID=3345785 RepID=UPI0035DDE5B4